jgi:hypothetical protein
MTLDWTMTIVRAQSKDEFHAVCKGKVTATFDSAGGAVYDGHTNGSAKTTDTFWAGDTKLPLNKSSAWFVCGSARRSDGDSRQESDDVCR